MVDNFPCLLLESVAGFWGRSRFCCCRVQTESSVGKFTIEYKVDENPLTGIFTTQVNGTLQTLCGHSATHHSQASPSSFVEKAQHFPGSRPLAQRPVTLATSAVGLNGKPQFSCSVCVGELRSFDSISYLRSLGDAGTWHLVWAPCVTSATIFSAVIPPEIAITVCKWSTFLLQFFLFGVLIGCFGVASH